MEVRNSGKVLAFYLILIMCNSGFVAIFDQGKLFTNLVETGNVPASLVDELPTPFPLVSEEAAATQPAGQYSIVKIVKGSDDFNIQSGIQALKNSLNASFQITEQNDIPLEGTDVIILFSHGSPEGLLLDDMLISWEEVAIVLNQSSAKTIFIGACFASTIYQYTLNSRQNILAWDGTLDAILIGLIFSVALNLFNGFFDQVPTSISKCQQRSSTLKNNPLDLLPLYYIRVTNPSPVVVVGQVLELRYTTEEWAWISNYRGSIETIINQWLSFLLNFVPAANWLKTIITNYVKILQFTFDMCCDRSASVWAGYNGIGCEISWEFGVFPPIGTWIQARGRNDEVLNWEGTDTPYAFPQTVDPSITAALALLCTLLPNKDTWQYYDINLGGARMTATDSIAGPGELTMGHISLTNTGPLPVTYTFAVWGLPTDFYDLPAPVALSPGETTSIALGLHPPALAVQKTYSYYIDVLFEGNVKATVNPRLTVYDRPETNVVVESFTITNDADYPENYWYDPHYRLPEGWNAPWGIVTVPAHSTATVTPKIYPPSDVAVDEYTYGVNVFKGSPTGPGGFSTSGYVKVVPTEVMFSVQDITVTDQVGISYTVTVTRTNPDLEQTTSMVANINGPGLYLRNVAPSSVMDWYTSQWPYVYFTKYTWNFGSPSSLGDYSIGINAQNMWGYITTKYAQIHYIDDITTQPFVSIDPIIQDISDGVNTISFHVKSSNLAGIAGTRVYMDEILIEEILGPVDKDYSLAIPEASGIHRIHVEVEDVDTDRAGDQSINVTLAPIYITDDDTVAPTISEIEFVPSINDKVSSLLVIVNCYDDLSGIGSVIIQDGSNTYPSTQVGDNLYQIVVPNPHQIGSYSMDVVVTDADNDRVDDALSTTQQFSFEVFDEDKTPPTIDPVYYPSEIADDEEFLPVSVTVFDINGIDAVVMQFAGETYDPISNTGNTYDFLIKSPHGSGIMYTAQIQAWDADNDWVGDHLVNSRDISFMIIDDDTTPPAIEGIQLVDEITPNVILDKTTNPIKVRVKAVDMSGIWEIQAGVLGPMGEEWIMVSAMQLPDPIDGWYELDVWGSTPIGPGTYILRARAWDADRDNPSFPMGDQLSSFQDKSFTVIDNDVTPPSIVNVALIDPLTGATFNSNVPDSANTILVKMDVIDASGVYNVSVDFRGSTYPCYNIGDKWGALIPNPHTLGPYDLIITAWDDDFSGYRESDRLTSTEYASFSIVNSPPVIRSYYANPSFPGNYPGTYTFTVEDENPFPEGWIIATTPQTSFTQDYWQILPNYLGHEDVLQVVKPADIQVVAVLTMRSIGTSNPEILPSGTIEFWMAFEGGEGVGGGLMSSAGLLVGFSGGQVLTAPVNQMQIIGSYGSGMHHIRVDFAGDGSSYDGLQENQFRITMDENILGVFDFAEPKEITVIGFAIGQLDPSLPTTTSGTLYIDAIGFSWDSNYIIGTNLRPLGKDLTPPSDTLEYPATYMFTSNEIPSFWQNWVFMGTDIPAQLLVPLAGGGFLPNYEGHQTVLHLRSTEDFNPIGMVHVVNSVRSSGTIEFWGSLSGTESFVGLLLGTVTEQGGQFDFLFVVQNDVIGLLNPDNTITQIGTLSPAPWHHYRVDFAGVGSDYLGLQENHYQLMVDQQFIGDFSIAHPLNPNLIGLYTGAFGGSTEEGNFYLDALGFSWDPYYTVGDNLQISQWPSVPEISLEYGTPDASLAWMIKDTNAGMSRTYSIFLNGALYAEGTWDVGMPINLALSEVLPGTYSVEFVVDDGLGAVSSSNLILQISGPTNTLLAELDAIISLVNESPDSVWRDPALARKQEMLEKLSEIRNLVLAGDYSTAYDQLLHDIKPKLTGLKTDEDEIPWGNGVFNNPWVINEELHQVFKDQVNIVLRGLKLLG